VEVATALGAPLILPALLFGGFFLNNGLVPVYLDWLRYLSWFMYSNEALSINQWDGLVIYNSNTTFTNSTASVLLDGEWVLKRFSFNVVSSTPFSRMQNQFFSLQFFHCFFSLRITSCVISSAFLP
jgi:ABC-2 type transporter